MFVEAMQGLSHHKRRWFLSLSAQDQQKYLESKDERKQISDELIGSLEIDSEGYI